MRIEYVEIQNFRKLKAVRIEFSPTSTLFVGANNSGKSSAMVALRYFLSKRSAGTFSTDDFTLSHWNALNAFGQKWCDCVEQKLNDPPSNEAIEAALPSLDVWLSVSNSELHRVRDLLPTLDWDGGLLGVRIRFEPKKTDDLMGDFVLERTRAQSLTASASVEQEGDGATIRQDLLWPADLRDFLTRRLHTYFTVRTYLLDPSNQRPSKQGCIEPQTIPDGSEPLESNPLEGLLKVDEISAQRGLGETTDGQTQGSETDQPRSVRNSRKLSDQLRAYYSRHLDPTEHPAPEDLQALQAIATAQELFDERLKSSFTSPINELEELNYPGVTDPKLKIATRLQPTDGLKHTSAVQYEAIPASEKQEQPSFTLPEHYNGLGYQNLIAIVFRLMSFRDEWMRVGKVGVASRAAASKISPSPPPLHLVLVEEPEAHLHAQVQQVFVRKAYDVLRNHDALGEKENLSTQLIVSTHSSHVAHESDFKTLRYFRRQPHTAECCVPTSTVCNLSEVFGGEDQTQKFVARYLHATHCDLFFADAAILVEGAAERMLVPHFIKCNFPLLQKSYVTLLEIGGSHAHKLRPLIEHLGLTTLIITDLDSLEGEKRLKSAPPKRGASQQTGNPTLKDWLPKKPGVDDLLDLGEEEKETSIEGLPLYAVRVAYQSPMQVALCETGSPAEMLATTFEEALVLENVSVFKKLKGTGMIPKFANAFKSKKDSDSLQAEIFKIVREGDKAAFALEVLWSTDPEELQVPVYISDGLTWLQGKVSGAAIDPPKQA